MNKTSKILLLGASGMVGSAIKRRLQGYHIIAPTRQDVELTNQLKVNTFFKEYKPDYVFLVAAKVGGIGGNANYPADFGYVNIMIQSNVIEASRVSNVKKLLFLGSSCVYPKFAKQPITEDELMKGSLETTNEIYALAKIFGIKLCDAYRSQYGCNFISAMPSNLYGFGDTFDDKNGHVIPALLNRIHNAKIKDEPEVICWGTGKPKREFLNVDDCADACVFLMERYDKPGHINVGTGQDIHISDLVEIIKRVVGYKGALIWDKSKPDGTPRKVLDTSKINKLGWQPKINFEAGMKETYKWYLSNTKLLRKAIG